MKTRNVLQISKFLTPPYGGVENHVESLCKYLKSYKPILLTSTKKQDPLEIKNLKNYEVDLVRSYGKFLSVEVSPNIFFKGKKIITDGKVDIVHGHLPNPWANLLIQSNNCPSLVTWHSDVIRQKFSKYFYNFLQKSTLKKVDRVIIPSELHYTSSHFLQSLKIENKISFIPIGIEIDNLKKEEQIDNEFIETIQRKISNKKVILTIGRHVYYKGYEYLIKSLTSVDKDAILIMVGEGPLTKRLKYLVKTYNLESKVLMLKNLKRNQLKYLYKICDIFTLPSIEKTEAFGIVSAEAMVFKKPTVVCDLKNGVNDLNKNEYNSLYAELRSPDDLSDKLNYLIKNEDYAKKLGKNGYKHVTENYNFNKVAVEIEKVYDSIL